MVVGSSNAGSVTVDSTASSSAHPGQSFSAALPSSLLREVDVPESPYSPFQGLTTDTSGETVGFGGAEQAGASTASHAPGLRGSTAVGSAGAKRGGTNSQLSAGSLSPDELRIATDVGSAVPPLTPGSAARLSFFAELSDNSN